MQGNERGKARNPTRRETFRERKKQFQTYITYNNTPGPRQARNEKGPAPPENRKGPGRNPGRARPGNSSPARAGQVRAGYGTWNSPPL
jgi:hypothetical protein